MKNKSQHSPKLLLDEHIWAYLAKILREQGFDVIHVEEVDLIATPDDKIMAYAVGEHRAVVTFNIKHYGVVVSKQLSQGELQRRVTKLLESVTAEELINAVRYL